MRAIYALLGLLAMMLASAAQAQPTFPERGTAPVVDAAGILDPATKAQLTEKLEAFETANKRQFVVATIPSLDGYDISDYGYQLGRHWGLGDKERNDGIILLVAPNERRVRIEVGYGLEAVIPDGLSHDIIENDILPRFKAGDMPGGIVAGADAIISQIELPPEDQAKAIAKAADHRTSQNESVPVGTIIWVIFLLLFFVLPALFGRRRGLRRHGVAGAVGDIILWNAIGSAMGHSSRDHGGGWGSGGGGFGGGGGFSGGGGSFGGGGASGSW